MSNGKTVLLITGLIAGLVLIVLLFVGAIVGAVFYSIGHSEAAQTAKTFLRQNKRLKNDIGEVKDFGSFVLGNINSSGNDGEALLSLKVIGQRQTVQASVRLAYRGGRQWRITDASYKNASGHIVMLLDAYEEEPNSTPEMEKSRVPASNTFIHWTTDDTFEADVLRSHRPVLVEFVTTYSSEGCKLAPILDAAAAKYADRITFLQMNVDLNAEIYQQYQVVAIPTIIIFEDGKERARAVGMMSGDEMSRLVDKELRTR